MSAFRRVEAQLAGPTALGILVPPGPRTAVILRPRALSWDLLPARDDASSFCEFDRDEAAGVARRLQRALDDRAAAGAIVVKTLALPADAGYYVGTTLADLLWLVCPRLPGQAYRPVVFAGLKDAESAAERVGNVLCPPADTEQEYYFNTQKFAR